MTTVPVPDFDALPAEAHALVRGRVARAGGVVRGQRGVGRRADDEPEPRRRCDWAARARRRSAWDRR